MSTEQSFFVLADTEKCTGCRACELACFAGHFCKKTQTIGTISTPVTPRLYLARGEGICMPVQCHHCEDAPCMKSCLTGAIERKDGVVVINTRKCIGCRNCAMACPFGAVQVYPSSALEPEHDGALKLVYKCDLCAGQDKPACAAACPNEALRLIDPATEVSAKRINAINAMGITGETAAAASEGGTK